MPKLTIDNTIVEVPEGTNVLEAARQVGVVIPHFCYHPALGAVGACRLCAMKFVEGPVKGIQMSCMIKAQDGMVVSTTDGEAAEMRRMVIEWLMINHPHDCPVCDEGGECLLQDYTIAGGHGIRRYRGKKRTFLNQELGPYIVHEMNRCIECYRCVRFYQDYAGGSDFGVLGSAGRVYFGRFENGTLQSPFSGNLVDICPTGVFTDKTARYRARYWDYEMAPSICTRCSLGCNTIPVARYRELIKTVARRNDAVNGWFICDRGRFANGAVNDPARLRQPLLNGAEVTWQRGVDALADRIADTIARHGEGSMALAASSAMPMEALLLLTQLASLLPGAILCGFTTDKEANQVSQALALMRKKRTASLQDIRNAAQILIIDSDLVEQAPIMALAVRQAWRAGARVHYLGKCQPEKLSTVLSFTATPWKPEAMLLDPANSVVIADHDTDFQQLETLSASATKVAILFSGPNAVGLGLMAEEHHLVSLKGASADGKIKGMLLFEPVDHLHPPANLEFLAVADWRMDKWQRADLLLPIAAPPEMTGTLVNYEGRAQKALTAMKPGVPVNQRLTPSTEEPLADQWGHRRGDHVNLGKVVKPVPFPSFHPARSHRMIAPGGELLPSTELIGKLIERLSGTPPDPIHKGRWKVLEKLDPCGQGISLI